MHCRIGAMFELSTRTTSFADGGPVNTTGDGAAIVRDQGK